MLGRPRGVLLAVFALTPVALLAWYAAWALRAGIDDVGAAPFGPWGCLLATVAMAIAPLLALMLGRRGSDPNHPRATGAALGMASGAWGAVLIDLHCDHTALAHVALGHVLPTLVLGLLGFLLGDWLLGVRPELPVSAKRPR